MGYTKRLQSVINYSRPIKRREQLILPPDRPEQQQAQAPVAPARNEWSPEERDILRDRRDNRERADMLRPRQGQNILARDNYRKAGRMAKHFGVDFNTPPPMGGYREPSPEYIASAQAGAGRGTYQSELSKIAPVAAMNVAKAEVSPEMAGLGVTGEEMTQRHAESQEERIARTSQQNFELRQGQIPEEIAQVGLDTEYKRITNQAERQKIDMDRQRFQTELDEAKESLRQSSATYNRTELEAKQLHINQLEDRLRTIDEDTQRFDLEMKTGEAEFAEARTNAELQQAFDKERLRRETAAPMQESPESARYWQQAIDAQASGQNPAPFMRMYLESKGMPTGEAEGAPDYLGAFKQNEFAPAAIGARGETVAAITDASGLAQYIIPAEGTSETLIDTIARDARNPSDDTVTMMKDFVDAVAKAKNMAQGTGEKLTMTTLLSNINNAVSKSDLARYGGTNIPEQIKGATNPPAYIFGGAGKIRTMGTLYKQLMGMLGN